MVSNVLLKPGKQDSQPFPHPPGGLSCHRRWGWMSNPAFHKSVLAGPDHLFDLHVPCDSIQDDLPQHQGLANRPGYPSNSCRWVSPLLISRKRNLHSPNRLDVKPTDPRTKKTPQNQNSTGDTRLRASIDLLACCFFVSSLIFSAPGRIEENTTCAPDPSTSCPKSLKSLGCSQRDFRD